MNFKPLIALIHKRTGIEVPSPAPQFEHAVRQRLAELKYVEISDYVKLLGQKKTQDHEWSVAIHSSTNRLTHFMRDEEQIDAATKLLVQAHRLHGATTIRIWCAGCSTGEEPYSLAILALEAGLNVRIVATDVNPIAVEQARRGTFAAWSLRRVPERLRRLYFDVIDPHTFRIKPTVASRVSFRVNNMVADAPPSLHDEPWHMVICRNVLIYYAEETISKVLLKMSSGLDRCGFLVLGASETVAQRGVPLKPCLAFGRIVYGTAALPRPGPSLKNVHGVRVLSSRGTRPSIPISLRPPKHAPVSRRARSIPPNIAVPAELPASYLQIQDALLNCLENNESQAALQALEDLVASSPTDIHARLSLGHMYLREHRFKQARAEYDAVLKLDDSLAEPHFFLGIVLRRLRQHQSALDSLRRCVFLEPTFGAATYLLGATALRLGNAALSRSEFQRTKELLDSSQTSLPLVTHPLFHAQFLESESTILQATIQALAAATQA